MMTRENTTSLKLSEIATFTHSELRVPGNSAGNSEIDGLSTNDLCVNGIKPLDMATSEDLSFFAPNTQKSFKDLFEKAKTSGALAMFVKDYQQDIPCIQLVTPNPMHAIIAVASRIHQKPNFNQGIHPTAVVDPSATVAETATVGAYSVIGKDVVIADGCQILPQVVIYDGVQLGQNCLVHSGAIIRENVILGDRCTIQNGVIVGSDGFGYFPNEKGEHQHIPHLGLVRVGNDVSLGANTSVDRATLGETNIGNGTKIDNQVQVGHNATVGERTLLCGNISLAGSSSVGSDSVIGGATAVADHIKVGNNVRCGGLSGVLTDLEDNSVVVGYPPEPVNDWKRQQLALKRLPGLLKEFRQLKKKLDSSS